ncbi:MAG: NRDE family protein [Luteimonas sp.]
MCLIAVAWRAHPRYRLALIANRDEFHARPTAAAAVAVAVDREHADVFGGRDLQAGGSWLLASTRGRLAAVTNVRAGLHPEVAPRSRGLLVRDFVYGDHTAAEGIACLARDAADYGRFNLLLWDGDALLFASNYPGFATRPVMPGLHAMSNGAFDAAWPKSGHASRALSAWLGMQPVHDDGDAPSLAPLFDALADTTPAPDGALPDTGVGLELERMLSPPFVRGERYGTRCSTIVLVGDDQIVFVERRFGPDAQPLGETSTTLRRDAGHGEIPLSHGDFLRS